MFNELNWIKLVKSDPHKILTFFTVELSNMENCKEFILSVTFWFELEFQVAYGIEGPPGEESFLPEFLFWWAPATTMTDPTQDHIYPVWSDRHPEAQTIYESLVDWRTW